MTDELMSIGKQYTPSRVRVGMDVEILDVDAIEVDYYGYKWAEGEGHYRNILFCIQFKHKWIEKPFWINVFKGAQAKTRDTHLVIATWNKMIDSERSAIGEYGALYAQDGIDSDVLEDGSESLVELIQAFSDHFFDDDDSLTEEEPSILSWVAEKVEDAKFFKIEARVSTGNPTINDIILLRGKMHKAEEIYRKHFGKVLCEMMLQRGDLPETIRDIITSNGISEVMFESITSSEEWGNVISFGEYGEDNKHVFAINCSELFGDETGIVCSERDIQVKYGISQVSAKKVSDYLMELYVTEMDNIILGEEGH